VGGVGGGGVDGGDVNVNGGGVGSFFLFVFRNDEDDLEIFRFLFGWKKRHRE